MKIEETMVLAEQGDPLAKESLRELQKQLSFLDKY